MVLEPRLLICYNERGDKWIWKGSRDGMFSVGSVKKELQLSNHHVGFYAHEWCNWIPAKCNIFAWRAEMERLPTRVELRKRKINFENELCVFCGAQEETANHLFTGCAIAAGVWQAVSTWCGIPHIFAFTVKDLLEMHKLIPMSARRKEVLRGVIIIACWRIWKARNERIFEDIKSSVAEIVADLKVLGFLWLKNRQKSVFVEWKDWCKFQVV
ncbi:uncharacterized protein LOC110901927 [Helianthus annuus]|uniref:uncharacterized protein LOC110901927 n=1 Tax=Helianthus annuus TaxID=4232 RepID=UPI000B8FD0D2|nr:uncharacterized protein LOC110901927 [Helianthus annuus]